MSLNRVSNSTNKPKGIKFNKNLSLNPAKNKNAVAKPANNNSKKAVTNSIFDKENKEKEKTENNSNAISNPFASDTLNKDFNTNAGEFTDYSSLLEGEFAGAINSAIESFETNSGQLNAVDDNNDGEIDFYEFQ